MKDFEFCRTAGFRGAISDKSDGDCSWRGGAENRSRLLRDFGESLSRLVQVRQVHGNQVVVATAAAAGRGGVSAGTALIEADGIATTERSLVLGISVADCVPLFLMDPIHGAAALVHAGREGTFGNIAAEAVRVLIQIGSDAADIQAVIGPSAGPCCYEVNEDMAAAWEEAGWLRDRRRLDLWSTNVLQLCDAGLKPNSVHVAGTCTVCSDVFFSYRGGDKIARNLALLQIC